MKRRRIYSAGGGGGLRDCVSLGEADALRWGEQVVPGEAGAYAFEDFGEAAHAC